MKQMLFRENASKSKKNVIKPKIDVLALIQQTSDDKIRNK